MTKQRNRVTRMLLDLSRLDDGESQDAAKALAILELEPRYGAVYAWCFEQHSAHNAAQHAEVVNVFIARRTGHPEMQYPPNWKTVSEDVALVLGIKQNHASMVLAELVNLGLMGREVVHDESGRHFTYWVT